MSFDEMYDEVLRAEFSPRGKHAATGTGPVVHEDTRQRGRHAAPVDAPVHDEDAPIHDEFDPSVPPAVADGAPAEGEGPRGLARYRNAAMVGAGGLACAAVGALLGGLGGYFTVNPAAAHSLASASSPDQSLAAAVNRAHDAALSVRGSAARGTASSTSLSGSLTQGIGPLRWLTDGTGALAGTSVQGTLADLPGAGAWGTGPGTGGTGSGSGVGTGTGSDCTATQGDLGLGCILDSLTTALGNLGTLSTDPTGQLDGLVPTLTGVLTDVTGTLADLSSLMPTSSLPLPSGGTPASGLPGIGAGVGSGGSGTPPLSGGGGLTSLLNGVTAAAAAATGGSTSPSLPSLPLSSSGGGSGLPGVPVTTSGAGTPAAPVTTTTDPATGGTTTLTVPLPSLPLPSTPPITVGGVSLGTSSSGSGSGLSLSLP